KKNPSLEIVKRVERVLKGSITNATVAAETVGFPLPVNLDEFEDLPEISGRSQSVEVVTQSGRHVRITALLNIRSRYRPDARYWANYEERVHISGHEVWAQAPYPWETAGTVALCLRRALFHVDADRRQDPSGHRR